MTKRVPLPVRRVLEEPLDDGAIDAAWTRYRLAPRRVVPASAVIGAGVVLAAAAAILVIVATSSMPGPLRLANGEMPGRIHDAHAQFSDGSVLELDSAARLETLENDAQSFTLRQDAGVITFDVVPGGPRRWTIECGLATVTVVGTRFTISRFPSRLEVSVERGAVLVRGPNVDDGARRLEARESIVVTAIASTSTPSAPADSHSAPIVPPEVEPDVPAPSTTVEARPPRTTDAWHPLADRGDYDDAYQALGDGGVHRASAHATPADLLALADVARLSGHPAEAVEPLELLLSTHASDPNAGVAAFTLGRVEHDALAHPDRAVSAFERALALTLPAPLVPDAWARLAQAREEVGDGAGARAAAEHYLSSAPDGPRARAMRTIVEAHP
jgi:transmembrane sensor